MRSAKKSALGFSFLELLASMAILGLLATIAIPFAETTIRRQKEIELRRALRDIRLAIDAYKDATATGQLPLPLGSSGYPSSLTDLTIGLNSLSKPGTKLYFIRRIPRDPFWPDSTTPAIATWGLRSFGSSAENPRPGADVFDVYSRSTTKGLNGVPYNEW
jgi:general secretion pathway protein G